MLRGVPRACRQLVWPKGGVLGVSDMLCSTACSVLVTALRQRYGQRLGLSCSMSGAPALECSQHIGAGLSPTAGMPE